MHVCKYIRIIGKEGKVQGVPERTERARTQHPPHRLPYCSRRKRGREGRSKGVEPRRRFQQVRAGDILPVAEGKRTRRKEGRSHAKANELQRNGSVPFCGWLKEAGRKNGEYRDPM